MRASSLLLSGILVGAATLFGGCGDDNGQGGNDLAMTIADMTGQAAGDLASSAPDLAGINVDGGGNSVDGGGGGATCTTACDCMAGLGCFAGKCTTAGQPVYCCGTATCPNGGICQNANGSFSQCGGGMPDLMGFDYCHLISCTTATVQQCKDAGCNMCVAGAGGMFCAK